MKRILIFAVRILDLPIALLTVPGAILMLLFRKIGSARMPITRDTYKLIGVFPIRDHYYEPLFQTKYLSRPLSEPRVLPGINLRESEQIELLGRMHCAAELRELQLDAGGAPDLAFRLNNGSFESGDAEFLYQFIRLVKPRRVIEIGSGNSTRIAFQALHANLTKDNVRSEHTCIEPYEMPWLERLGITIIRRRVEDLDGQMFAELEPNDLLFIDSSHVIRPQGDVLCEYFAILPRLASGVYVHVHDIFTPRDYLRSWLEDDVYFWNEQYLLEALLSDSDRYRVVASLNYLKHSSFEHLKAVCPYLDVSREPGSFYFRIK